MTQNLELPKTTYNTTNLGAHLINVLVSLKVFMSTLIYSLQNVYPTVDLAEAHGDTLVW